MQKKIEMGFNIAFESTIFLVTVWKTWKMVRSKHLTPVLTNTFAQCIFQNGKL